MGDICKAMKFGIIHGDSNRIPIDEERRAYNQHPNTLVLYPKFYPDDLFAILSPYNLDLDLCNKLDAVIYYSGFPDAKFVNVIDKIKCKLIVVLGTDYRCLIKTTMRDMILTKRIMDSADFILGHDILYPDVIKLFTTTPVIVMEVPLPIEYALECAAEDNDEIGYDIVIPYGPFETEHVERNCYIAALAAQRLIDTCDDFNNMVIFNMNPGGDLKSACETLRYVGVKDFTLMPLVPYKRFVQILSKSKFGLTLDMNTGGGKFACDCALMRKPSVQSSFTPYARKIYYDIPRVLTYPLDISAAVQGALSIDLWNNSDYDKAFNRAQEFRISKAAAILEEAVFQ